MANQWFRLYAEFATDPKIQMLSEADQRRFVMLLCLRCSNGDVTLHDEEVAFQLRISNEEWMRTKCVLVEKRMICDNNKPTAWDRRQYVSDSSAARVHKHREAKKRACNVTVTPPDTDTDTDTDTEVNLSTGVDRLCVSQKNAQKKRTSGSAHFEAFWKAWPSNLRKVDKKRCLAKWVKNDLDASADDVMACLERTKASSAWDNPEFIPMPATWLGREPWLETNVILLGYTNTELAVIEKYNRVMAVAGWPDATVEPYSRDRAVAIGKFLKLSAKPGDWVTAFFEWLADALEPRTTTGFDWAIREETFLRAKEGTFAMRAAQ